MIAMKLRAAAMAGASALTLSGCLLSPGQFTSQLDLMQDGSFAFVYDGEIQMLALSKLAEMGGKVDETFEAECWDEDFESRDCTPAEVAEQKSQWEAEAETRRAKKEQEAEQMKAFLGGIDPSDPEAARELAARLQRQRGWKTVDYKGDGLFDVDFSISGQLTHDFTFPTVEKMAMANSFVSVILRDGGQVRIDAPGFAGQKDANPMFGGLPLAAMAAMSEGEETSELPRIAVPDGKFTIVTDGRILANNTDEGPQRHARGQALGWTITPRTEQAPTALIAFD